MAKVNKKPINNDLDEYKALNDEMSKIIERQDEIRDKIRNGMVEVVVVFIDMVDSTSYKIQQNDSPEKWILRLKQFGEVLEEYVKSSNGRIVKYIGDEIMAIFDDKNKIEDSLSLIHRIKKIEEDLEDVTKVKTKIKIAIDIGYAYLMKYEGHEELDPQGTVIDRCARISKYCEPSTVLSSFNFVNICSFPGNWKKLGSTQLHGLDKVQIYQFGEKTIELNEKVTIMEKEYEELKEKNDELSLKNKDLQSKLYILDEQIKELNEKPKIEIENEDNDEKTNAWNEIKELISELKRNIGRAKVPASKYARALFLYNNDQTEEYNSFNGRTFDELIGKKIVIQDMYERFELNTENKRNIRIIEIMEEIEVLLFNFTRDYENLDDEDLFDYTLTDADFWDKYLGYTVV